MLVREVSTLLPRKPPINKFCSKFMNSCVHGMYDWISNISQCMIRQNAQTIYNNPNRYNISVTKSVTTKKNI